MENILKRHVSLWVLAGVLFAQLLGLAAQIRRKTPQGESARLVRVWVVSAITPFEKAVVHTSTAVSDAWQNYFYLRNVNRQNEALRQEIQRMRLEQVRMAEDAGQARRLQTLLGFKEQYISQTIAAQVISTTGSEFSRGVYIDKGSRDGIKPDMPVITPAGIVGKVYRVYSASSLVLEINDPSSGAGVILQKSRLQGILKGSGNGETFVANIMADEKIEPGETVLTSGGDRIYPKGLPVGKVAHVRPAGTFLNVDVRPSADLDRLEEVLVISKVVEKAPDVAEDQSGPIRAIDILAERLPSVPKPAEAVSMKPPGTAVAKPAAPAPSNAAASKPAATPTKPKPSTPPDKANATPAASTPQTKPTNASDNAGDQPRDTATPSAPAASASSPPALAHKSKPDTSTKDTPR
ncbi:MAG: rod shape-determining protein MreC [Terriglobales bacterium]